MSVSGATPTPGTGTEESPPMLTEPEVGIGMAHLLALIAIEECVIIYAKRCAVFEICFTFSVSKRL